MPDAAPRSLLWRLGTLVLAVTVVSLVLHVAVVSLWLQPLGDRMFAQVAARAHAVRALLLATPAAQRTALAASLSDMDFLVVRGAYTGPSASPAALPFAPTMMIRLRPDFELSTEPTAGIGLPPLVIRLAFEVDAEPWHIEVGTQPPIRALLGTGIGWLALAAAGVGASFLIGLRFIVGPIRRVADRLAAQGAALRPLAVPPGASAEVHSLVDSFNRLAHRVAAADRTRQQLLAGVSHDLRTPLARLRLRIETQCAPAVADAAENELRAVEHIVSQFLAFVQGDIGAGMGRQASLHETAGAVVASYAERGAAVRWQPAGGDMRIGELGLRRLLCNLIDNALAYGRPPIVVAWSEADGGAQELGVWDHGEGLSSAQFRQACEPFVRLSKDADIGHCGLGLAIVAQIAQQCGAQLTCRHDADGRFGIVVVWSAGGGPPRPGVTRAS